MGLTKKIQEKQACRMLCAVSNEYSGEKRNLQQLRLKD